jgi:serine/threonine-protein kinase RsbW
MTTTALNTKYVTRPYRSVPTRIYATGDLEALFGDALSIGPLRTEAQPLCSFVRETVEIELPSEVRYIDTVVPYLLERTANFGIVCPETSDLPIALNEALANAIKHGNCNDPTKRVRIRAEFSMREARFTVSDEGHGFNLTTVPNPRAVANFLKPSGWGLLLIHQIMDEVLYYGCGNVVTMIKYPETHNRQA